MKIKVCVLAGGTSTEREVSLLTCDEIKKNLNNEKFDVTIIEIPESQNTSWVLELINLEPNIVLSALHGGKGEDGSVQGLLECLSIPYVGSKVMSSSISMKKAMSKLIMRSNNIPVIDDVFIPLNDEFIKYEKNIQQLGFPLIVKPNMGGSSVGISIVNSDEELIEAINLVKTFDDDILIEKYITGKEVTCGIVENKNNLEVLTVLDIDTNNKFYDYKDDTTSIEFSKLPLYLQVMIQEIAKKVFITLNCKGYGRVDMIVDEEQIYVLEMNTLPGLTSHSLIPKAASLKSSFGEFLEALIYFELDV